MARRFRLPGWATEDGPMARFVLRHLSGADPGLTMGRRRRRGGTQTMNASRATGVGLAAAAWFAVMP